MRPIDADALYQSFGASGNCSNCPHDWYKCQYYNEHTLMEFCERIDDAPTIDPVKRGRWEIYDTYKQTIDGRTFDGWCECSECRTMYPWDFSVYNYCPHCGAKMDGGDDGTMAE